MLVLFALRVVQTWSDRGFFNFLGVDYAIYGATAHVVTDLGWTHLYDMKAITAKVVEFFFPYYESTGRPLITGPSPYPAPFVLPFIITNLFGPVGGFAAWTSCNILMVLAIARGMLRGSHHQEPTMYLVPFVFLPVLYNLFLGQLAIIMTFGIYKFYMSFQEGREFRAGFWLGLLLLKPQFALIPAIVLVGKGRWRALGGLLTSGIALALSTVALVGIDGVRNFLHILRAFSGFRRVPSIVYPEAMINIRGILVVLLPESITESQAMLLVLALSAALTLSLIVIWRGPWDPSADRFPRQMLGTLIVVMLTGFHNHIHGATVLIVPVLAEIRRNSKPIPLSFLWLTTIFLPTFIVVACGMMNYAGWTLVALMACSYWEIVAELYKNSKHRLDRRLSIFITPG